MEIIPGRSVRGMYGGSQRGLSDEKEAAGRAKEEATDGDGAVVTSVDLSI